MRLNTEEYLEPNLDLLSICSKFRGEDDKDKSIYLALCKTGISILFGTNVSIYITKGMDTRYEKYINDFTGEYSTSKRVSLREDINRIKLELKEGIHYYFHSEDLGLSPVFDFTVRVRKSDSNYIGCDDSISVFDAYILYNVINILNGRISNKDYEIPIILGRKIFATVKDSCKILGPAEDRYWGNISFIVPEGRGREFIQELEDNDIHADNYEDVVNVRLMHSHTPLDLRPFLQILKEYI